MNCSPISPAIPKVVRLRPRTHFFSKQSVWLQVALGILSIGLIPTLTARPSLSAERLTISYGIAARSIPINSLETYAKTGKVDDELAAYVQHADKEQLNQLRQFLLTPIPLNAVQVSQFLYTPIGKRLLENLGEVVQQESGISGFYAIRAALILAAADPQGLTLLNILRKFPSRAIAIDLARSLEIARAFQNLVNQTQRAIALINKQSSLDAGTASTLDNTSVIDPPRPGNFRWQKQTITLNDTSRSRTFPADIYLPNVSSPRPVIVISHGLGSDRTSFAYLAEYLASYGFVVAVPEHPGSDAKQLQALLAGRSDQVTEPREFIDRPLDIKYLLNHLSNLSQADSTYRGRLNLEQVGIVGQSFGGYTALALAGAPIDFKQLAKNCPAPPGTFNVSLLLQCLAVSLPQTTTYNLSDPRVKSAIAINQIDSSIMGQASLSQIKIPVMIMAGSADTVAPALPEQIQPFTWLTTPNKYLVLINGGTHFSTIGESQSSGVPVPEQVIGPNPALAQRYVRTLSLPFFQTYLANEPSYRRYLNADYINTISQQPLPLSLVQSLSLKSSGASQMCKSILFCSAGRTARFSNKVGSKMLPLPSLQNWDAPESSASTATDRN
ncbi:MAG: alpha/beta hydrolase [Iphinoe sp. HA4291-MV1]|jgi:predicted dienelactone hydrolase|nr:alpha/beta hydrolase [Iphinoe sp. HA4291-MV1]